MLTEYELKVIRERCEANIIDEGSNQDISALLTHSLDISLEFSEMLEGMKEGVSIRIADLEAEITDLRRRLQVCKNYFEYMNDDTNQYEFFLPLFNKAVKAVEGV